MNDTLEAIYSLPDVTFGDDISLEDLQSAMITDFCERYQEITGKPIILSKADPNRIILLAVAQYLYQGLLHVDRAGKMNFLKYAYGPYLRHLAAFKGVTEMEPQKATVTVRWSLEEAREQDTAIPAGTRITGDWEVFFETLSDIVIPAGDTDIAVKMTCTEAGEKGNNFAPGELCVMADPVPFIADVVNTTQSAGGMDAESDESLAERIYLAPSGYSVAGSEAAYIYHAKSSGTGVGDVRVSSPSAGVVDVRFLMADGSLPDTDAIAKLSDYLSAEERRPLTDYVQVSAPDAVSYTITATYYISSKNQSMEAGIRTAVETAVEEYEVWQGGTIGRDINPNELVSRIMQAGAKRVVVTAPASTVIPATSVGVCAATTLTYGGLEND